MTTRADVKINGEYNYLSDVDPTASEDQANGYNGGETWLNLTSGDSFKLTDPIPGTWTQIEQALDMRIDRVLKSRELALFMLTGSYFYRFRQERLDAVSDNLPGSIDRFDLDILARYVSLYAEWTLVVGTGETEIQADAIVGALEDLKVGDNVTLSGSIRSDGLYEVKAIGADSLTVDAELLDSVDLFLIIPVYPTDDFAHLVGRMIWYDETIRNKQGGLASERIGTYQWTAGPVIGGLGYPQEIAAGFVQYLNAAPLGTADHVG